MNFGPLELGIILAIVVVLFGATRVGDVGKGIGRGIREFRRELREGDQEAKAKEAPQGREERTEEAPKEAAGTRDDKTG